MVQISWMDSLEAGLSKARTLNKLAFVDFYSPT